MRTYKLHTSHIPTHSYTHYLPMPTHHTLDTVHTPTHYTPIHIVHYSQYAHIRTPTTLICMNTSVHTDTHTLAMLTPWVFCTLACSLVCLHSHAHGACADCALCLKPEKAGPVLRAESSYEATMTGLCGPWEHACWSALVTWAVSVGVTACVHMCLCVVSAHTLICDYGANPCSSLSPLSICPLSAGTMALESSVWQGPGLHSG